MNNVKFFLREERIGIPAGTELIPEDLECRWQIAGSSFVIPAGDELIFTVRTNDNGAQRISWTEGTATIEHGLVSLALQICQIKAIVDAAE